MSPSSHHASYRAPTLLIDGRWCRGASAQTWSVRNPATGEVLDELGLAHEADVDRALQASQRGFEAWRAVPAARRSQLLLQGVGAMRARRQAIATALTLEQGKPLAEALAEVDMAGELIQWYAEEARRVYGRLLPSRLPGADMRVSRHPVGPVAAFSPWNFPLVLSARKIGGALAAGCSVLLKPAEETPGAVAAMVECFHDQGLPEGALQMLFGQPAALSRQLLESPVVRKLSFTGSVEVGRLLARQAAEGFKRMTLELGGHAPAIIWRDADVGQAARLLAAHKFRNAGQACLAPSRFIVHQDVLEPFTQAFVECASSLRVGDGMDPATTMGPLANARRVQSVSELVLDARRRGAQVIEAAPAPDPTGGYYAPPVVLCGLAPQARVLTEEPFGPVAPMLSVDSLEQALHQANATAYGLAAYLFTDSASVVHACESGLEVGALAVNNVAVSVPEAPFGGVKHSGMGSESGIEGMEAFLESRFVHQVY